MSGSANSTAPLTKTSLANIPLSYASVSLGQVGTDTLPDKLHAISQAGFTAIELGFPDLVAFANQHLKPRNEITATDYDALCTAALEVKAICAKLQLQIMMLQPFANFEGWADDSPEREEVWTRARGWRRVMEACGCDMLQVGSTDSPEERIGRDRERFVRDLRLLADFLAEKGMKVAYENWCWSTHAPDWEDVWVICKAVDRENFGLCLDTFQSAGSEWADPTSSSGLVDDGRSAEKVQQDWEASCARLAEVVDPRKIFLLQISDAYRIGQPLEKKEIDGKRPRARWSNAFRPLPFEGYLPVVDFAKAVLKTGFRGWFSYEVFDAGPDGTGRQDVHDLNGWTERAIKCHEKLMEACEEA